MVSLRLLTKSKTLVGYIREIFDDTITREIGNITSFTFSVAANNPIASLIKEEMLIEYQDEYFLIKQIIDEITSEGEAIKTVVCDSKIIELMYEIIPTFRLVNRTAREALTEVLFENKSGWTVGDVEVSAIRSMSEEHYANRYYLLTKIVELYGGEIEVDTKTQKIHWREKIGKDTGVRIAYGHNVNSIRRVGDAYEFGTRLYALGYDNITVAEVSETGQPYIDADTVAKYGVIEYVWKTEIRDVNTLYELAKMKLELIKNPRRSYEVDATIITHRLGIGDTVRIKDGGEWVSTRVVKLEEHPSEPWKNKITLDTVPVWFRTLQERLAALMQTVDYNKDIWDRARMLDDSVTIEYGKRDYETMTVFQLSRPYYSKPTVWLGLQKEDPTALDPETPITLVADFKTELDANHNILYVGVIASVVSGPSTLPGFKITMNAFCSDPVTE